MKILFLCPRWGSESLTPVEFVSRVQSAGYDGVEVGLADGDTAADEVVARAADAGLVVVPQHWQTLTVDFDAHLKEFEQRLRRAVSFRPLFVNSHTGRDCFDLDRNLAVFDLAAGIASEAGVPIHHETHRGRCLHSPWRTTELLAMRPETEAVLDMSHWCNVCESLLDDQEPSLSSVVPSVAHIHARVGHAQGPQVSDPRAPEWSPAVEAHLRWWDRVVERRRECAASLFTVTPEFGPPPYLPVLPWTQQPVASQWDINVHMMQMLRGRWSG